MRDSRRPSRVADAADARRRLAAWLAEWEVDRALGGGVPEPPGGASPEAVPWGSGGSEPVRPGQIRLFPPALDGARSRPVYAAVLREEPDGKFAVAPYGRFSVPAFPGELLTGRQEPCLRVLCLWNERVLPAEAAAATWVTGAMTRAELRDALGLLDWVRRDAGLPPRLARRTGPELRHPFDPRVAYRREETARMNAVAANAPRQEETWLYGGGEAEGEAARRVAEERGAYGTPARRRRRTTRRTRPRRA
jgi:hypothetical protein